ncbi:hypothetical protein [Bacillus swezeyi]|uniref:hypothetical protein n=1 Tax=Bacillus swezeyi TaxID=1925020 RepID=UPI0027DD6A32|nr:hypothetical protein [Bacillus swezeyi]
MKNKLKVKESPAIFDPDQQKTAKQAAALLVIFLVCGTPFYPGSVFIKCLVLGCLIFIVTAFTAIRLIFFPSKLTKKKDIFNLIFGSAIWIVLICVQLFYRN